MSLYSSEVENNMRKQVTILVPCYNEEQVLRKFYRETDKVLAALTDYDFYYLFVNDGSNDNTLAILRELQQTDDRVAYVSLSRNFGKEPAMLAGMDYADRDALIIMDADLQDPPELIPELLAGWEEGYQDVYAQRRSRAGEGWFKKFSSKLYYRILDKMSDIPVLVDVGDFRLLDRECILAMRSLREGERYTKGLFSWVGFRKKAVLYDRDPRAGGETHWNYRKLFGLAIDGITSFSTMPLQMSSYMGLVISLLSFVYMFVIIFKTLCWGDPVPGYPTLITVLLFVSGVQLMALGVIGEYLGKVFKEAKRRPPYLVGEKAGNFTEGLGQEKGGQ